MSPNWRPPCLREMRCGWTDDLRMCFSHRKAWRRWYYGVMVWGCFAGDTVSDLFIIHGTLNQQAPHHSTAIRLPIRFALSGTIICFSTGQWPNTPPGCVRAIWTRRVMECCIRWPGLHNHPTSTQLRWIGMSWTADWRKSSQQVLSICWNSFKTVGKTFQVKLVEGMPRVYNAVIKAKGGYFEESQIHTLKSLGSLKNVLVFER